MNIDDLNTLPEEVQDFIWEAVSGINYIIDDKYSFNFEQFDFINKLEDDIILKKKNVVDLPKYLEKMPGKFEGDFRELALQMAKKIFWPLQDYIGGVDRLILRLGAKVPSHIVLKKKQVVDKDFLEDAFQGDVKTLTKQYKEFKDLRLTPNKIVNKKGRMISPSVQNWIKDYVHFLGAGQHSSLERTKYISKNKNALKLSDKHKDSLRFLLLSYDEGLEFYFNKVDGLLIIKEHRDKKNIQHELDNSKINFEVFLENFKDNIISFRDHMLPSDIIMSEAEGDINKVRDILWNALGIGDKDKTMACLRLLIEKRSFDAMLKEDSRFKSILKRFIGIKYGQNMERSLDENIDQLIARRIFLELLLMDKLSLAEEDIYLAAYYLTNTVSGSGQVVYLDKSDQKFKWRNIQVLANKFAWVDKI